MTRSAGGGAGGGGVAIASAAASVSKVARVVASTPSIVFSSETAGRVSLFFRSLTVCPYVLCVFQVCVVEGALKCAGCFWRDGWKIDVVAFWHLGTLAPARG